MKFNHTRSIHSDSFFCFFLWKRKKIDFKEIVALNTKSVKNLLFTTVLHCKRTLRITAPGLGVTRVELPLIDLNEEIRVTNAFLRIKTILEKKP